MISKARYYLYRNLHTSTFSLLFRGKVVSHPTMIKMEGVIFTVSDKLRQKVIDTKVKNVHAKCGALSIEILDTPPSLEGYEEIYYCPYSVESFIKKATGEPVYEAKELIGLNNKVYARFENPSELPLFV